MNQKYDGARERFAKAQLNWESAPISAILVYDTYTFDATHVWLTAIPPATRACAPVALTTKTATGGYCASDDITLTDVSNASSVAALVLYYDTGDSATSVLIAYIDDAPDLPLDDAGTYVAYMDQVFGGWFRV